MNGQCSHQGKSGPLNKLIFPFTPFNGFLMRKFSFVEEIAATLVTNIPGVKVFDPAFHLHIGYHFGHINHTGNYPCFMNS